MTDIPVTPTVTSEFSLDHQQARDRDRLADEVRPANKAAVFDPLAAAGVTTVVVLFDGSGDSGQIDSIDAHAADTAAELPAVDVEIASPAWDGSGVERRTCRLRVAIEALAYDFLEETHGGWEDNEGAYGEFTFDVAHRTIALAYNERVLTSDYFEHQF
ncbi:MAG: hypothetical protein M3T55_14805 [Pseudomonadota bacterium]|nr:hypothetical protein [Pseudomonadota bacterium]